jgi:hypothetical protein
MICSAYMETLPAATKGLPAGISAAAKRVPANNPQAASHLVGM